MRVRGVVLLWLVVGLELGETATQARQKVMLLKPQQKTSMQASFHVLRFNDDHEQRCFDARHVMCHETAGVLLRPARGWVRLLMDVLQPASCPLTLVGEVPESTTCHVTFRNQTHTEPWVLDPEQDQSAMDMVTIARQIASASPFRLRLLHSVVTSRYAEILQAPGPTSFLEIGEDSEEDYEGADLVDGGVEVPLHEPGAPGNSQAPVKLEDESTDELFEDADQDASVETVDDVKARLPDPPKLKQSYREIFPEYSYSNPFDKDHNIMPRLMKKNDAEDQRFSMNAQSVHLAAGAKVYASDITKRTVTILLEEKSELKEGQQSTMILMDIIKLFMAPFVAVLYSPIGNPLGRGIGGGGKTSISGPTGKGMGMVMKMLIAFPLGLMMGILVANMLTEGLTYSITWQVQGGVLRRIPKDIADGIVSNLNDYMFNAASPTMRDIIKGMLIDILSDTISNSLHHTLIKSVSDKLGSTLTPATMHYYWCVYCYYYGDYCDICFKVSDFDILHRMWNIGLSGEQWTFDGP